MKKHLSRVILVIVLAYVFVSLQGGCGDTESKTYETLFIRGATEKNNPYHQQQQSNLGCGLACAMMYLKNLSDVPMAWDSWYFESQILISCSDDDKKYLLTIYPLKNDEYRATQTISNVDKERIVKILLSIGYQPNVKYNDLTFIADKYGYNYVAEGLQPVEIGNTISKYVSYFWRNPTWDYKQFKDIFEYTTYENDSQNSNIKTSAFEWLNKNLTNNKMGAIIGFDMWPHSEAYSGHAVYAFGLKKETGTADYKKWDTIYVSDPREPDWSFTRVQELNHDKFERYYPSSYICNYSR